MTKNEHDKYNTFDYSIKNRVVLNIASKFHKSWVGRYGCSTNVSSRKSYSGIIAYSPALILDNIEDNAEKICFLINGECSIDYIVSVFFSIYLIEFRKLPKYYREILDYIEAVENNTLEINNTNIINLFTVIKSLSYLKSLDNIEDEYGKKMYVLKKGLKIIEYILMRLEKLNNYTKTNIFDGSLIEKKSKFEEEIKLIEDDYNKYLNDTSDEENGIVLKDKFKVYSGEDNNKIYVDTLIFLKCSNSIFYRQWANNDKTSPSKKGYKFIIGIERKYNGKRSEERKEMEKIYDSKIILNRYVISVDLNMGLKLYDLAMYLEMFEQIREKEIFSNDEELINKWRDKKSVDSDIFQDYEWCVSKYPWYDGQLNKFSIVNSSTVDSILSIDEVKDIAKKFTEEYIDEMDLNYIYSFNYKYGNHKKINQILEMNSMLEKFDLEIDKQYFLNIIEEYLNNTSDSIENYKVNIHDYTIFENKIIDELKLKYKMNFEFECKIYMFSYGIGFIRIRIKSKKMKITDVFTENIASLNKILYKDFNLLKQLFKDNGIDIFDDIKKTDEIRLSGCNIFHIVKVYNENISEYNKAEMVDKIINEYYNEMLFSVPKNLIYGRDDVIGFSKKGAINIMSSNNLEIESQKKYINIQEENNWKRNFPMFLFALNQRKAMIRFSEMLAIYDKRQKTNKISQLRLALLKFVTQSWFSQITEDEFGMEIYNNWCEVFESEKLLNELNSQITTVDDYNKNRITNIIETVSIIGFPILALSTIFGMSILETKGITIELEYVLLLSFSLFIIGIGLLKRFKLF